MNKIKEYKRDNISQVGSIMQFSWLIHYTLISYVLLISQTTKMCVCVCVIETLATFLTKFINIFSKIGLIDSLFLDYRVTFKRIRHTFLLLKKTRVAYEDISFII